MHFYGMRILVFNVTFNSISVISWGLVLLVEETYLIGGGNVSYWWRKRILLVEETYLIGGGNVSYWWRKRILLVNWFTKIKTTYTTSHLSFCSSISLL